MTDEQRKVVESYTALLAKFIDGNIDATAFENSYLHKFKNELMQLPQPIFEELDRMFGDVDAYCPDPYLRSDDDLDEGALKLSAIRAFLALKAS